MEAALSTDRKGAIAELAIARAAIELGIDVYRPVGEGTRFDLIFDFGDRLDRVQCKWAPLHGDVIVVRAYSCRRTAEGLRRRAYEPGEIDAFAAYCPEIDQCFYLPGRAPDGTSYRSTCAALRVATISESGVNWAADFAFEGLQSRLLGP